MYNRYIKRFLDMLLAFVLIVILMPLMICIGIAIKIDSTGPILFKQNRIGKDKKIFSIIKFRTMKIETPENVPTHLFNNSLSYITRIGKILRITSLDELPQLFNILKGEMSFIGPRPALWNQYDLIEEREIYGVNKIYPGITGLAQINGRDELDIKTKVSYDFAYAKNISFINDAKIFFMTIIKVFIREGIKEAK